MISVPPAVQIRGLVFGYPGGEFTLDIPALAIERGEKVAVIGPSGTGKTTLLHLVAGVLSPRAGRVEVGGETITDLDDRARRAFRVGSIGLVFQEFELLEYLSVRDNVLLPYRIASGVRNDSGARERAAVLARGVGIEDKLDRLATRLSQGEKQRVALCRALVTEPALVLADEPTGNLDPTNTERALDLLFDDVARRSATLIAVTHDHTTLDRFDRVVEIPVEKNA